MVYPYTPLNSSSFYDVISQIIIPFTPKTQDNLEDDDWIVLAHQAISDLLFNNHDFAQEKYNPEGGHKLYLSKMFVYCVKITEGFLNEYAIEGGVFDDRAKKARFINYFLLNLNNISRHNLLIEVAAMTDGWGMNHYVNDIHEHETNPTNKDIENLYQCALSFYSCQLICYLLNNGDSRTRIQTWLLNRVLPRIEMEWREISPQKSILLERLLSPVLYGLSQFGGEWTPSNQIALGFFSAYMTKDKMAWADDGRNITKFTDADFTPEYQTLLSMYPDLEAKSRFSKRHSGISRIGGLLWSQPLHDPTVHLSNSLKESWSITGAVFQLIPPPDISSNSVVATRTLNYSNRGFLI